MSKIALFVCGLIFGLTTLDTSGPAFFSARVAEAATCKVKEKCGSWGPGVVYKKITKKPAATKPKKKVVTRSTPRSTPPVEKCTFMSFSRGEAANAVVFAQNASAFNCPKNKGMSRCVNCEAWINCKRGKSRTAAASAFCRIGGVARNTSNKTGIWVNKKYAGPVAYCDLNRTAENDVWALNY